MAKLTSSKINASKVITEVTDEAAGGLVVFIGTVRNQDHGRKVVGLEYEAYGKMAEAKLREVEEEAKRRWPIMHISIIHRKGSLRVGDVSVVVAVSARHRAEAFEAAKFAIDTLKYTVPIWKRERASKGKTDWVLGEPIQKVRKMERGSLRRDSPS